MQSELRRVQSLVSLKAPRILRVMCSVRKQVVARTRASRIAAASSRYVRQGLRKVELLKIRPSGQELGMLAEMKAKESHSADAVKSAYVLREIAPQGEDKSFKAFD
ncbi:hypothetical protein ACN47E_003413 [Coniothyrium glycines]